MKQNFYTCAKKCQQIWIKKISRKKNWLLLYFLNLNDIFISDSRLEPSWSHVFVVWWSIPTNALDWMLQTLGTRMLFCFRCQCHVKTRLKDSLHLRVSVKCNPNWVAFDTTLRACGITVRVLTPLSFLVHSIRLEVGLG